LNDSVMIFWKLARPHASLLSSARRGGRERLERRRFEVVASEMPSPQLA
jgi:hypothetical protein